jgi:hypothetical protein
MMDVTELTDAELSRLSAQVNAEQRRRGNLEFQPEVLAGHRGTGAGWSAQSGRMITDKETS